MLSARWLGSCVIWNKRLSAERASAGLRSRLSRETSRSRGSTARRLRPAAAPKTLFRLREPVLPGRDLPDNCLGVYPSWIAFAHLPQSRQGILHATLIEEQASEHLPGGAVLGMPLQPTTQAGFHITPASRCKRSPDRFQARLPRGSPETDPRLARMARTSVHRQPTSSETVRATRRRHAGYSRVMRDLPVIWTSRRAMERGSVSLASTGRLEHHQWKRYHAGSRGVKRWSFMV